MKDTCPWWRDAIFSQAVSQSVNNIYWVPNERRCHETERRHGLWPWGAARTMTESEKRDKAQNAVEAASQQGQPGGWASHVCRAPPTRRAVHSKGLFLSELPAPSRYAPRDVVLASLSLSFPNCKMNSNQGSTRGRASVCAAHSTAHAGVTGHRKPGRARGKQRASAAWDASLLSRLVSVRFQRRAELWNYCFKVWLRRWQKNRILHIWL